MADADRLRERLVGGAASAAHAGDPSPFPSFVRASTSRDLARYFGTEIAADVVSLRPGRWSSPILSIYGAHLFRVERSAESTRLASGAPPTELRPCGELETNRSKGEEAVGDALARLRRRYRWTVDGRPPSELPWLRSRAADENEVPELYHSAPEHGRVSKMQPLPSDPVRSSTEAHS
jgi:hypothetical protein